MSPSTTGMRYNKRRHDVLIAGFGYLYLRGIDLDMRLRRDITENRTKDFLRKTTDRREATHVVYNGKNVALCRYELILLKILTRERVICLVWILRTMAQRCLEREEPKVLEAGPELDRSANGAGKASVDSYVHREPEPEGSLGKT